jgi:PAS domain S-box-containing protein
MQKFPRNETQNIRSIYTRRKTDILPVSNGNAVNTPLPEHPVEQYISRLKKAEEDITLFSSLVNLSRDALVVADPATGDLLYVNDRACCLFGHPRQEMLCLNLRDLHQPAYPVSDWSRLLQTIRHEGQYSGESQYPAIRGCAIFLSLSMRMCAHAGREYLVMAASDITERRRESSKLLRVTRALRTLGKCNEAVAHAAGEQELVQEICRIIVHDGGYRMAWVGYGEQDDKKIIKKIAAFGHDEGYINHIDATWAETGTGRGPMGAVVRTGRACLIGNIRDCADFPQGKEEALTRGYASVLGLPLKLQGVTIGGIAIYAGEIEAFDSEETKLLEDLAGNVSYGIMSLRLREEHSIAERSLARTLHELESIMLAIPDILFRTDLNGNLLTWNKALEKFSGLSPEKLLQRPVASFFAERDRPALSRALAACVREGKSELEFSLHDRRGTQVLFNGRAVLMRGENGAPAAILGTARDITEHRRAEQNERALQAQLLQSQKMEAIGQLAGGIAHDFNNILTAIIGYGNIVLKKLPESDKLRVYLENMLSASNRAANLTRSLLTFSRKQPINPQPVNVNTVVQNVEKLLQRVIGEDIELKTDLQPEIASVLVDSGQLEQVLINLATNARDAMPGGGILALCTRMAEIGDRYIRTHGYGRAGKFVVIAVSDTGTGMPEETRRRVFEPFFTTKDVGKGTGLGLSIAYGSIKQHNGYINVASSPGEGSVFEIYLPAVEKTSSEVKSRGQDLPAPKGTETVLLAEDDAAVRSLEKNLLEDSGYRVIEAIDGQDAIEKLRLHGSEIRLLISDVIMPKKSGGEVYEEAKRIHPAVKALFASGYPAEIIKNRDLLVRGLHFVSKPISPRDFLIKVRETLDA